MLSEGQRDGQVIANLYLPVTAHGKFAELAFDVFWDDERLHLEALCLGRVEPSTMRSLTTHFVHTTDKLSCF